MLKEVLGLPEDNSEIRELSGGQQKMVSLSLTFLHQPRLLILDEPTVGSDPVLGNCIWNYLHQRCREGISVIIVTHYIEGTILVILLILPCSCEQIFLYGYFICTEAAFGHVVGIMRNGRILVEGSPSGLTERFARNTLEEVFLHLCTVGNVAVKEESTTVPSITELNEVSLGNGASTSPLSVSTSKSNLSFGRNLLLNLWILSVLIRKNLTRFFQFNISFLIFLIPAFQALILCTLYNRDSVPVSKKSFSFICKRF